MERTKHSVNGCPSYVNPLITGNQSLGKNNCCAYHMEPKSRVESKKASKLYGSPNRGSCCLQYPHCTLSAFPAQYLFQFLLFPLFKQIASPSLPPITKFKIQTDLTLQHNASRLTDICVNASHPQKFINSAKKLRKKILQNAKTTSNSLDFHTKNIPE